MAGQLLEAKLHPPRRRRTLVARPRLTGRVGQVLEASLTLVSASAGFGKTTLLTEWASLARDEGSVVAWLSLDARDNDPAVFVAYLIGACGSALPEVGPAAEAALRSDAPLPAVLVCLLNDLAGAPADVVVVLDDYHAIESRAVHDAMSFVVENLPSRVHLVVGTRADPPFALARLRARGELVEVRAADLRFTPQEAATYLTEAMGLPLGPGEVAALEGRTEGWIAALQLAALSLQGRDDAASFVAAFSGDDRYIVDYLVEEVLQRQPRTVRDFLIRTSLLTRLTGALCDAVTGQDRARATLEDLDRANLFLVPLDDQRRWYRYHHLFADVLQARLLDEEPALVPELHRRASAWFEEHGDRAEAIRHAFAGGDVERAADLVELAAPAMRRERRDATLRSWFEALPDDVVRARPVLGVGYVGSLMVRGEVAGVEERLADAERWLTASPAGQRDVLVVDHEAFATLPSAIAMYRAGLALLTGDVEGTMRHARAALDLAGEDDHLARGAPAALLALALWTRGDLDDARLRYAEAITALQRAGHDSDALGCTLALGDVLLTQGRLREAGRLFEDALPRADGHRPPLRGAADMHVALAEVLRERNELPAARAHLRAGEALGEGAGLAQNPYRRRLAAARMHLIDGDAVTALERVDDAQRVFTTDYSPDVRPIAAIRARVLLALGRLDDAAAWARHRDLSAADTLDYLREYEHVTLARILLAEHRLDEARPFLERLAAAAQEGGRIGSLLEVLALQALAATAAGRTSEALATARRAAALAAPEGHVRVFVDEGPSMGVLLAAVSREPGSPAYARALADAFRGSELGRDATGAARRASPAAALSDRELDVVRLLATELSGPEIARRLYVSVNTLRTHTKKIYAKLGATNRRTAVRRATELGLLTGTGER
jgi:LuxR family maltose regulon positive regulatory protein